MGQYYIPAIFPKEENRIADTLANKDAEPIETTPVFALLGHHFGISYKMYNGKMGKTTIGLKLMEHSYVGNPMVKAMEYILANEYAGYPVVWGGDYGDEVFVNPDKNDDVVNAYHLADNESLLDKSIDKVPLSLCKKTKWKFLLNHDTHQWVEIPKESKKEWRVHPLPLLTCNGNGRGGGDYRIDEKDPLNKYIGYWCGEHISVSNEIPDGFMKLDITFPMDE